jgi:polysaccharide export outer membrane protein
MAAIALAAVVAGCAPSRGPAPVAPDPVAGDRDPARVAELFQARAGLGEGDYCLGPGDVLRIDVFGWDAMRDLRVRVSSSGSVPLPMLGDVPAAGRTETQLQAEIERRLRNGYMHDPHVTVYVQRFQSQQVSVTGAVARPGLYGLTRENRTIYDVLAQAGGQNEQGGGRVLFSPTTGGTGCNGNGKAPAARDGQRSASALSPIEIEIDAPPPPGVPNPLMLPVVGGDTIVVTRGRFMVDGWVARPGLYSFTPGMTAYGATSVAGGALFPADLSNVRIVRARRDGAKEVVHVDLGAIERGAEHDVTLREGDVVRLDASTLKMIPYSVYWMFTSLFRVGAGISVAGV